MLLDETMLDAFVRASDRRGGPNVPACEAFWRNVNYKPTAMPRDGLDPFGAEYMEAQLTLYREVSGRGLDQAANEMTSFDLPAHVAAANPYGACDPAAIALHLQRLSRAIQVARPRLGAHMLDMGCGWGLSSELAAYLGLDVTGVDINPHFVSLVNQRSTTRGFQVKAVQATFDDYVPERPCDMILFYECLHHAVRPWEVIERLSASLTPGGAFVLAGKPINEVWWPHWGMRLDPLSIYCIRKFGWFESGWSLAFITSVFERAGMSVEVHDDASLGHAIVARRQPGVQTAAGRAALAEVAQGCSVAGWMLEPDNLVLLGRGSLRIAFPEKSEAALLDVRNHRALPVALRILHDNETLFDGVVQPGAVVLELRKRADIMRCELDGEVWIPDEELNTGDLRSLSLHVVGLRFIWPGGLERQRRAHGASGSAT